MNDVKTTLRTARLAIGMTQQELADKAGVHVSLIRKIEGGKIQIGNITAQNYIHIKQALKCRDKDLLENE